MAGNGGGEGVLGSAGDKGGPRGDPSAVRYSVDRPGEAVTYSSSLVDLAVSKLYGPEVGVKYSVLLCLDPSAEKNSECEPELAVS